MSKKVLVAIWGKSASGKDTMARELRRLVPGAHLVRLDTTRPPRPGEPSDAYWFTVPHVARKLVEGRAYAVAVSYRGWIYALDPSEIKDGLNVGAFSPKMAGQLKFHCYKEGIRLVNVYAKVGALSRMKRSVKREGRLSPEMVRRLLADAVGFAGFERKVDVALETVSAEDVVEYLTREHLM